MFDIVLRSNRIALGFSYCQIFIDISHWTIKAPTVIPRISPGRSWSTVRAWWSSSWRRIALAILASKRVLGLYEAYVASAVTPQSKFNEWTDDRWMVFLRDKLKCWNNDGKHCGLCLELQYKSNNIWDLMGHVWIQTQPAISVYIYNI